MPLVDAKCTNCGATLKVDNVKDAAICEHCGSAFIVEKAINNYNTTNHNYFSAQVVNVYGSMDSHNPIASPIKKFEKYQKELSIISADRLISPSLLVEVIEFIDSNPDLKGSNRLYNKIVDYSNNICFSFDFSYNKGSSFCEINNYQSLWKNSGRTGNDGNNFTEWIFYKTEVFTGKKDVLRIIQQKITEYYIKLLVSGKTTGAWSSYGNGSLWKVQRTSKLEFLYVEEKLNNKFLLPYFYKGLNNASILNSIGLGDSYIFVLGRYAVKKNAEHCDFEKDQLFIDEILKTNVSKGYYLLEMNRLAKKETKLTSRELLSSLGVNLRSGCYYQVESVDQNGINYFMNNYPNGLIHYTLSEIDDLRVALTLFRKSLNLCLYCGGKFTGLINKYCSRCKKTKDY